MSTVSLATAIVRRRSEAPRDGSASGLSVGRRSPPRSTGFLSSFFPHARGQVRAVVFYSPGHRQAQQQPALSRAEYHEVRFFLGEEMSQEQLVESVIAAGQEQRRAQRAPRVPLRQARLRERHCPPASPAASSPLRHLAHVQHGSLGEAAHSGPLQPAVLPRSRARRARVARGANPAERGPLRPRRSQARSSSAVADSSSARQ